MSNSVKQKGSEKDFDFLEKIFNLGFIKEIEESKIGERVSKHEGFMMDAIRASKRSSCFYVHSGSVIVHGKRAIASGYNGAAARIKSCLERDYCFKEEMSGEAYENSMNSGQCRGVHSEINAMLNVRGSWPSEDWKSKLYTTIFSCNSCTKSLITSRLFSDIIFGGFYDIRELEDSISQFSEADIKLHRLKISDERKKDIMFGRKARKYSI